MCQPCTASCPRQPGALFSANNWLKPCTLPPTSFQVMPHQLIDQFDRFPDIVWDCILAGIAIVIGLIVKFMLSLLLKKKPKDGRPAFSVTRAILSRLGQPFSYFLPLLAFNFLLPLMKMRSNVAPVINKIVEILLAITFANVLIGVVKVFEDYV